MQRISISPISFLLRILVVSTGLMVLGNLLASGFKMPLGPVFLVLGILFMGIGNLLGLPARRYERQCGVRHINLFKFPAPEEYIAGNLLTARHAASFCCFENAVLLAGMIILVIGFVILF